MLCLIEYGKYEIESSPVPFRFLYNERPMQYFTRCPRAIATNVISASYYRAEVLIKAKMI